MFCTIPFYFYQSKLGFCICFFNCQSCRCGQLSHNSAMRDLGNPNFWIYSYITFQLTNRRCSHVQTKVVELQLHTPRTYEFTYSYIFIFIPQESRYWWRNTVFLTHVGIRQMPTWLPTWKAKSLYHVGAFFSDVIFSATSKVQSYQNKTRENSLNPNKQVLNTNFKGF